MQWKALGLWRATHQSIGSSQTTFSHLSRILHLCRCSRYFLTAKNFLGPKESLLSPRRASPDRLVLAPAAAAPLSTAQAGAQRQVAAHAGHEERQGQEGQPAGAAQGVRVAPHRVITGAGLPELSLRVRHAVVEQALCAPHAGPLAEAVQSRVRGVSAAAPPVLRGAEDGAAVHAAGRARRRLRTGAVVVGGDGPGFASARPAASLTSP